MFKKLILLSGLLTFMFACQTDKGAEVDVESMVEEFIGSKAFVEFAPLHKSMEKELLIGLGSGGRSLESNVIRTLPTDFEGLKGIYKAANYPNAEKIASLRAEIEEKRIILLPMLENIMKVLTKEELAQFESLVEEEIGHLLRLSASEGLALAEEVRNEE